VVTLDAYPGRVFSGRVDYVLPQLDANTRTLPVRLAIRMAEQQRRKTELSIEFVDLPGERLPLEDNTVDTVVSTFTLCTIPGVSQAIQGIRRVLRPEGKFIDCRPDGRRNDYVNNSCPDSGSSFLRVDEGTGLAARNVASETTNLGHRVNLQIAIGGCRGEDRLICLQHE